MKQVGNVRCSILERYQLFEYMFPQSFLNFKTV